MTGRGERWDRVYERDRYPEERRYEERDDIYVRRGRDHSDERYDRRYRAYDDEMVRDRRYYDEEPRYVRRDGPEYDRRVVIEKERDIIRDPSPPPPRRPGALLRRQSSLDTFDRRPLRFYEREEYGPPARREDYRAPAYVPIPLPRTRALPPPGRRREYYDEIEIADPGHYGDEEFRALPERIREREYVRTRRRRDRSRDSRTTHTYSHRSSSRSSSVSSRSSSSGTTTVKSEYPKKGKTRIPARLVSKRALIDLGYPYIEEGNTVIVLKALGQDNIDELLKLSEDYKKSEMEIAAARSVAGNLIEERREEVFVTPPVAAAAPVVAAPVVAAPVAAPVVIDAAPPATVEVVNKTTVVRDISPARSTTSYTTLAYTDEVALVDRRRSHSRSGREIRAEIRALEAELHERRRGDVVRAERMSDGALVLFEEKVEKVEEPRRGVRIEKDKKGPPPAIMRAMLATLT